MASLDSIRRVEKYLCAGQVYTDAGYTTGNYILTKNVDNNISFSIHSCAKA